MKCRWILVFSLVLFSFQKKEESLSSIVQTISSCVEKRSMPIIGIGGCAGVGKSTFADILKSTLAKEGINSVIIRMSHFRHSRDVRVHFENPLDPKSMQWHLMHQILQEIRSGHKTIVKPKIDQLTKEESVERLDLQDIDCILFEGAYALSDQKPMDFSQYLDFSIYLETTLENIYDWKWGRDLKKTKPRTAEEFYNHMIFVIKDYAFHVYPSKNNADCILQMDDEHYCHLKENTSHREVANFNPLREKSLTY